MAKLSVWTKKPFLAVSPCVPIIIISFSFNSFRFTEIMKSQLPAFREGIKQSAMEDLMVNVTCFFKNLRIYANLSNWLKQNDYIISFLAKVQQVIVISSRGSSDLVFKSNVGNWYFS